MTMKQLAVEYRMTSAVLAARIRAKEDAGASAWELRQLRGVLRELRVTQRCLAHYYDLPRPEEITTAGMTARGYSSDDH